MCKGDGGVFKKTFNRQFNYFYMNLDFLLTMTMIRPCQCFLREIPVLNIFPKQLDL